MKKILLFLIPAILALCYTKQVSAQANFFPTAFNPTSAITNTGIDTLSYVTTRGYDRILVGATYTRASGTAAGTMILEYSIAGVNYKSDAGDTLTVTNVASQTLYWNKTNTARYWRIRIGGATTVTATVAAKLQTD